MIAGYAGLLLRAARERAGMGLLEMAEATGQHPRALSRMEEGRPGRPVAAAVVKAYEEILDVPLVEAAARLGVPGLETSYKPGPVPVRTVATSETRDELVEPLRQVAEAVHLLACEIHHMWSSEPFLAWPPTGRTFSSSCVDSVNGKVCSND